MGLGFKFDWRKMGWKLMEKIFKICLRMMMEKKKKKNFGKIQMWKETIPHLFYLWIIEFNLKLSKWQLQLQTYEI
jgi:hypothetical protein